MAFDEKLADILRKSLNKLDGVTEKKMFGGLCFLVNGNMICGVHQGGGMARVGKANEDAALQLNGVEPLSFTGRKMGGMVDMSESAIRDRKTRNKVIRLAIDFVDSLPAK